MADDLKIWAEEINNDVVTGTDQRRSLNTEEFRDGILRGVTFTNQQYNSLMYLLTLHSNPFHLSPYLYPSAATLPASSLEMNGQAIALVDYPELGSLYGATLPDLTLDAPTGFTYIVRKS